MTNELATLIAQLDTLNLPRDFDRLAWLDQWLHTPVPALGGICPIDHIATPDGLERVCTLLAQIGSVVPMPEFANGCTVIVRALPPGFLDSLPDENHVAIRSVVGQPAIFVGYNEIGEAEVEFGYMGDMHTIWVDPSFLV